MKKVKNILTSQAEARASLNIEDLGNGQYRFIQLRDGKELHPYLVKGEHQYGKTMTYYALAWYNVVQGKTTTTSLGRLLYIYFVEDVPADWHVDHKNNDPHLNVLSNLQAVPAAVNEAKKGIGRNQHTAGMTDEEILELRRINKGQTYERKKIRAYRKTLNLEKNEIMKFIREQEELYRQHNEAWHKYIKIADLSSSWEDRERAMNEKVACFECRSEILKAKSRYKKLRAELSIPIKEQLKKNEVYEERG